jgi:hypothetical protein
MPHCLCALIAISMISFGVARMAFADLLDLDARGRIERGSRALRLGDEFGVLHQLVECRTQRRDAGGRHGAVNEGARPIAEPLARITTTCFCLGSSSSCTELPPAFIDAIALSAFQARFRGRPALPAS